MTRTLPFGEQRGLTSRLPVPILQQAPAPQPDFQMEIRTIFFNHECVADGL
jgi:hypothetical protein